MYHAESRLRWLFVISEKMIVTSRSNDRIKAVQKLQTAKARKETGLHLIEGDKLVSDAIESGAAVQTVFALASVPPFAGVETVTVSESVLEALCSAKTPQHMCATVETPSCDCPDRYPDGLIVVLDRLQDPGNLGTIIRTADALGARGVLLSPDCADPFSPKSLRAAMGSTYHLPVWTGPLEAELDRLKQQGFTCVCGHLAGGETLPAPSARMALVVGNEGQGVSEPVAQKCVRFRMPMRGHAKSLNAAVFAALMMQRLIGEMPE